MLFKKSLIILTVLTSSFVTSSSFAADLTALCNNCSDYQMKSMAISRAPTGGVVHVIDFKGDDIKAYEVEREHDMVMVYTAAVKSVVKDAVQQLRGSVNTIEDLAAGGVDVTHLKPYLGSYSNIESAHTVAGSHYQKIAMNNALNAYFKSNIVGSLAAAITSLGQGLVNQILPVNISVNVRFPKDGTTYTFVFKGVLKNLNGDIDLVIEPVLHSGLDDGVRLAENGRYAGYQADGSTEALERVLNYMIQSGVTIIDGNSGIPSGSATIRDIACNNEVPQGCTVTR